MGDGTEFDDALLGLPGFRVVAVTEDGDELLVGHRDAPPGGRASFVRGDREDKGPASRGHERPAGVQPARDGWSGPSAAFPARIRTARFSPGPNTRTSSPIVACCPRVAGRECKPRLPHGPPGLPRSCRTTAAS